MGRYIDWSEVTGRYKDAASIGDSTGMGSYWLIHAEGEVDARVAARYSVPFSPAPIMIKDLCIDLTYWKMTVGKANKKELKNYLDERFKGILAGTIILTNSVGPLQGEPNAAWSENSYHTSFGPDSPINFQIDSNWIQNTQNDRGQFRGNF